MTERENKGRQTGILTHSHSTPVGVDGGSKTPPTTPKKGGKMLAIRVQMLDDCVTMFQIQAKAFGKVLFEQVCRQLNLLESDYFGLEYQDPALNKNWIDMEKPLSRQTGLNMLDPVLKFSVKFYTPDPARLEEEFTRYLYCLQIKRDLKTGELQCNDNTAALMSSYIVQAECGDYSHEDYPDHRYLSTYKFVPNQDPDLERKIMENHKKHEGQTPAEADLNLLETARRCDMYGIKLHPAKDQEGVPLNLAVAHMGILVFQNYTKLNTFSWAKIRKLSFKRKKFLIKLHPEGHQGCYKEIMEFFFDGRDECKNFWKKCVEHHGFFRCSSVKRVPRQKTRVLSRGSSFRYSGRTQKQIVDYVRDNYVKREPFQRSYSVRHSASAHTSVSNVNTSISAQPLLPLSDQTLGTPASHSCGSMTISSRGDPNSPTAQIHDFDTRELDTPSLPTSRQDTLSQPTSVTSSPQRYVDRLTDDELSPSPQRVPLPSEDNEASSPTSVEVPGSPPPAYQNPPSYKEVEVVTIHAEQAPPTISTTPSPVKQAEPEVRKKRYPTDKAYFIAKEILMTERTYKKDLEVLNVWFRDDVSKEDGMPNELLQELFTLIDPIYDLHCGLLRDVETRLATWEGRGNAHLKGDYQRIGDVFCRQAASMEQLYSQYVDGHSSVLENLDSAFRRGRKFEIFYKDFEMQKVCYLPLTSFLLKPLHRLLHYQLLLERLVQHYGKNHQDYKDCMSTLYWLNKLGPHVKEALAVSENFVKLVELQRDLTGFDSLVHPKRHFIREGCLQKFSRKAYQQRIFFLFSDVLIYCNRNATPTLQFKVHGTIPLRNIHMIEENTGQPSTPNCFTIYGGNRAIVVAAINPEEKQKWLTDLNEAVAKAKEEPEDCIQASYLSLKSCSSSDEVLDTRGTEDTPVRPPEKPPQQRSNTTVHVCWHRNTSLSMIDLNTAVKNQLSGYLLRKFKNSNGWQKLWVVCTNFCLFFYKNFQDEFPLASLPLLGYIASTPTEQDAISKDYVFKLQFKNHVYFFRAESEYTFGRWMEVISNATQNHPKENGVCNGMN